MFKLTPVCKSSEYSQHINYSIFDKIFLSHQNKDISTTLAKTRKNTFSHC